MTRNAPARQRIAALLLFALTATVLTGCGGRPDVPPDDLDIPNTLPREQILYREAKHAFTTWIGVFEDGENINHGYQLLTWQSRQLLKAQGVHDDADFGTWFVQQKEAGREPFGYRFSRLDILEVDMRDTIKAAITATCIVSFNNQKFETVGIFYLKRERNAWKVPFAERNDFIRGWWQKEKNFDISISEAGLSNYASGDYKVEFKYPVAWDVAENVPLKMPYVYEATRGLELRYNNPSTQNLETVVRITELPESMVAPELLADTTIKKMKPVREEMVHIPSEPNFSGRVYWLYHPEKRRLIAVYGAVDTSLAPYGSYAESIHDLVRSIEVLK